MPRRGLDTPRVVEEAIRIADSDGIEEVTLARIAAALDVRAPSLYNHVDGRSGLLRLIALRSLSELAEGLRDAAVGRAGEDALRSIAGAYRDYARRHPGAYASTPRAPAAGDEELAAAAARVLEPLLTVLAAWGLEGERALHQIRVIRSAMHGFVTLEAEGGFGLPLDLDESYEQIIATLLAGLDAALRREAR